MKRLNRKVSKLVADLEMYTWQYQEFLGKQKYHPDGLTDEERMEKMIVFYRREIVKQRLFLEHGIAENSLAHTKKDIKEYYGEFHTIHDIYNYEELESAQRWLEISQNDLINLKLEQSKAVA